MKKYFRWFLWLVCAHSICVGLGLIFLPSDWLAFFEFTVDPYRFFSTQGGVFHLVMAVAYGMAARDPDRNHSLLHLIIIAKMTAFIFLSIYFVFFENILTVALSGVADGLMAIGVLLFYSRIYLRIEDTDGAGLRPEEIPSDTDL